MGCSESISSTCLKRLVSLLSGEGYRVFVLMLPKEWLDSPREEYSISTLEFDRLPLEFDRKFDYRPMVLLGFKEKPLF